MSKVIDSKVVEMRFDNQQFEKNVRTSINTLDGLKNSLKLNEATKSLDSISEKAKKFSLDGIGNAVTVVIEKFSALDMFAKRIIENIADDAFIYGKRIIKSLSVDQVYSGWSKYAQKTQAVQTIMAATANSFSDTDEQMAYVNKQLEQLNWYTDETSANFIDMTDNIGKFTSAGVDLKTAVTAMQGITNWGFLSGASLAKQSSAMYNLSQALGVGVVTRLDWRSIENANMATIEFKQAVLEAAAAEGTLKKVSDGVYKTVKGTKITAENMGTELEEKWFTSDVLLDVLDKYGNFTNMLYEASNATGMFATELLESMEEYEKGMLNLQEVSEQTGMSVEDLDQMFKDLTSDTEALGRKAFQAGQEAITYQQALESVKDAVSTGWMKTFEIILGDYKEAKELFTDMAEALYETFVESGKARNQMLEEWKALGGRDLFIESVSNAWNTLISILGTVKEAFRDIFPAMTAERLVDITQAVRDFTARIRETVESEEFIDRLRRVFAGFFSTISLNIYVIKSIIGFFKNLIKYLEPAIKMVFDLAARFGDWLKELRRVIKQNNFLGFVINQLFKSVDRLIQKVKWLAKTFFGLDFGVDGANHFLEIINNRLLPAIKVFGNFFLRITDQFISRFYAVGGGFEGLISGLLGLLRDFAMAIANSIEKLTGLDLSEVRNKINEFFDAFGKKASSVCDEISHLFSLLPWTLWTNFVEAGGGVPGAISAILGAVIKIVESGLAILSTVTGLDLSALSKTISGVLTEIKEIVVDVVRAVINFVTPKLPMIASLVTLSLGVIKIAIQSLIDIFTKLINKIDEVFNKLTGMSIGDAFDKLKDKAVGLVEKLNETFDTFHEVDTTGMDNLENNVNRRLNPLGAVLDGIGNALLKIWDVIKKIAAPLKNLTNLIGDLFWRAVELIGGLTGEINTSNIIALIKAFVVLKVGEKIKAFLASGKKLKEWVADMKTAALDMLRELTATLKDLQKQLKAKVLESIAKALLIMAIALFVLSMVSADKMQTALTGMLSSVIALTTALKAMAATIKKGAVTGLFQAAAGLLILSIAVLVMASALKKISKLDPKRMILALYAIKKIVNMFMDLLEDLSEKTGKKNKKTKLKKGDSMLDRIGKSQGSIIKIAAAILIIAVAIKFVAGAMAKLAKANPGNLLVAMMAMGILFKELSGFLKSFSSKEMNKIMKDPKALTKIGAALIIMAIAIKLLVGSIVKMAKADPGKLLVATAALGIVLLMIVKFLEEFSSKDIQKLLKDPKAFNKISTALIAVAIAVKLLTGSVVKMTKADPAKLLVAVAVLGIMMLEIVKFLEAFASKDMQKVLKDPKAVSKIGTALITIAIAVKLLTSSVIKMAKVDAAGLLVGAAALGIILLEIAKFLEMFGDKSMKKVMDSPGALIKIGAALILISIGIRIIAGAIAMLAKANPANMVVALVTMMILVSSISAELAFMSKKVKPKEILAAGAAFLAMAMAMAVLVPVIALFGSMKITTIAVGLAVMAASMALFAYGAKLLVKTKLIKPMEQISGVMIKFGLACALVGVGMLALGVGLGMLAGSSAEVVKFIGAVLHTLTMAFLEFLVGLGKALYDLLIILADCGPPLRDALMALGTALLEAADDLGDSFIKLVVSWLWTLLSELNDKAEDMLTDLMEIILKVLTAIKDNIQPIVEDIVLIFLGFLKGLGTHAQEFAEEGILFIVNFFNGLAMGIEDHKEDIKDAILSVLFALLDLILSFFGIHSPSTVMADVGKNLILGLVEGLLSLLNYLLEGVGKLISGILDAFANLILTIFDKGVEIVTKLVEGIASMIWKVIETIGKIVGEILGAIGGVIETIFDKGVEIVSNLLGGIASMITKVGEGMAEITGAILGAIGNVITTIFNKGVEIVRELIRGIKSIFDDLTKIGSDIIDWIIKGVTGALGLIFDIGGKIFDKIKEGLQFAASIITAPARFISSLIFGDKEEIYQEGYGVGDKAAKGIAAALENNAEGIKQRGQAIGLSLKGNLNESSKQVADDWGKAMENIYGGYSKHTDEMLTKAELAKKGVFNSWEEAAAYFAERLVEMESQISDIGERLAAVESGDYNPTVTPVVDMDDVNSFMDTLNNIKETAAKMGINIDLPNQENVVNMFTKAVDAFGSAKDTVMGLVNAILNSDKMVTVPVQVDGKVIGQATYRYVDGLIGQNMAVKQRIESYYRYANGPTW